VPIVIIIALLLLTVNGWWSSQLSPVSPKDEELKAIVVTRGQSVSEVADKLKKENLIKSTLAFNFYIKQQNLADKIKAGTFKLSPSMSTEEIVNKLKGGAEELWVTLLEGWRLEEMGKKLSEELGIEAQEFVKKGKEGYMFPDTYLFPKGVTVDQIVKALRNNFESKYSEELRTKIKSKGLTPDEGVMLASIVEREARSDKARTEIAGILLKRLNIDMGLNVDASLQYVLGYQPSEKSWWKRHLTKDDKKVESPYNTYLYRGLPPAPIANPSLSSLNAVANANPNTPYLYYYHDSKGGSHYATTLEEHNENVANNP